jgi:hypothetical protein
MSTSPLLMEKKMGSQEKTDEKGKAERIQANAAEESR